MKVTSFKQYQKGTLQGFFELHLDSGLSIRGMTYHTKDGKRWVQLPAKPYQKPDGGQGWSYIVSFPEKDHYHLFQDVALKALDSFQRQARRNPNDDFPTA